MTVVDTVTGEILDEPRSVTPAEATTIVGEIERLGTVRTMVDAEEAAAEWQRYTAVCQAILGDDDLMEIQGQLRKKKSAWRKLAKAFDISDRIVESHVERDERSRPIFATIVVEAEFKRSGRTVGGYGEVHVNDRCCPSIYGAPCPKSKYDDHKCCSPDCSGFAHFNRPSDIIATAHTKAKNRAIADMIGAGEVSAEELSEDVLALYPEPRRSGRRRQSSAPAQRRVSAPQPAEKRQSQPEPVSDTDKARARFYAIVKESGVATTDSETIHKTLTLGCWERDHDRQSAEPCRALSEAITAWTSENNKPDAAAWDHFAEIFRRASGVAKKGDSN